MTDLLDPPRRPAYPMVLQTSRVAWREWLHENHDQSPGIWLVTYRPGAGQPVLAYDDFVEEALCFGWIDGKAARLDETRTMRLLTPRQPGSSWSRLNKLRIERLLAAHLMHPAGLARLAAARQDGSWESYDAVEAEIVTADLAAALAMVPGAMAGFAALGRSERKQLLWWVVSARRPATRASRIARITARMQAAATTNPAA